MRRLHRNSARYLRAVWLAKRKGVEPGQRWTRREEAGYHPAAVAYVERVTYSDNFQSRVAIVVFVLGQRDEYSIGLDIFVRDWTRDPEGEMKLAIAECEAWARRMRAVEKERSSMPKTKVFLPRSR